MSGLTRASFSLHFSDGSKIETFQHVTIRDAFTDPLGHVEFLTTPPRGQYPSYRAKLAKGEAVSFRINGIDQGIYLIETVDVTHGEKGSEIKCECRTPLVTPYQGDVDPDFSFQSPTDVPVASVVLKVFGPYGFDVIQTDSVGNAAALSGKPLGGAPQAITADALKHKEAAAHENETAYQFASRIFTRLGCALRVDRKGALLLSAPAYDEPPAYTVWRSMRAGIVGNAFVGDVHVHDSNDQQFSEVTVRGQRTDIPGQVSTQRPVSTVKAADAVAKRSAYHSTAAPFKPKYIKHKSTRDTAQTASVAKFELGMRASHAFWIEGEVDGWVATTGAIWTVDTMARVVVADDGIDEAMYLLERTLTLDSTGGQKAKLKFIESGALTLGDIPNK